MHKSRRERFAIFSNISRKFLTFSHNFRCYKQWKRHFRANSTHVNVIRCFAVFARQSDGHITFMWRRYFTSGTRKSNSLLLICYPFLTVRNALQLLATAI
jgi:hypothetical protein